MSGQREVALGYGGTPPAAGARPGIGPRGPETPASSRALTEPRAPGDAEVRPASEGSGAISSFIETQLPVSRLSKESYKERSAKNSQTLTPLGKWWGRKPLVMVRAVILGLLMPASSDPRKDRDVFLALLTMDEAGLRRRKNRNIPLKEIYQRLSPSERSEWFAPGCTSERPKLRGGTKAAARKRLQRLVFDRMGYDEKLKWCDRPEQIDGPSPEAWKAINEHLGTNAESLPELVRALGERQFGHVPRIGDAFCGGGSVTFEAARLGCEAFGSDLNPVAALLTWGALNIVGGGKAVAKRVRQAQERIFAAVDRQITEWGIEHNDVGWRADAYLYCTETDCPECGWRVPLAPSWVVGEKPRTVAILLPVPGEKRFAIEIRSGVERDALSAARNAGTVKQSRLECSRCHASTPMSAIRGDRRAPADRPAGESGPGYGLRPWESEDLVPRPGDVFQERLYCVRWRLPALDALLWAEQTGDLTAAVPEWVPLEDAIAALTDLLDPSQQDVVATLRKRDWPAEDRACEEARHALEAAREAGYPRHELMEAARRAMGLEEAVKERNRRAEALAKSLPGALYRPVKAADREREQHVLTLLRERFADWQALGYLPSRKIVPGDETTRLMRERGWTHWHHLFTPRQLLTLGLLSSETRSGPRDKMEAVAGTRTSELPGLRVSRPQQDGHPQQNSEGGTHGQPRTCVGSAGDPETASAVLGLSRCADYNSKLCRWHTRAVGDKSEQTFSNQALNTMSSFACRALPALGKSFFMDLNASAIAGCGTVNAQDAREVAVEQDVWLTDPPYADAINYHELSEYLLAWHQQRLSALFPGSYADSKRALAVRGTGVDFRRSMVDCYRNLTAQMPDDGLQVVMFTHQDAKVWADLTLILWAAGLRVTAAWTIATETQSALKEGNYVQGTVLMVLRKQTSGETAFLDEVIPEVETEVERQLRSMLALDDQDEPNFSDADYQLAAYAAALRVLTRYRSLEDLDIARQLARERGADEPNPIEVIIEDAVRTASNFLVPAGLPSHLWRRLGPEEKLYLKGLEVESHGEFRAGVYQEFARGFGVRDYRPLLRTGKANETRLKTATELGRRGLGESSFGASLVRHALYGVWRAAEAGEVNGSLTWLQTELFPDYWPQREALIAIFRYLAARESDHWRADAAAARLLAGAVENDHV